MRNLRVVRVYETIESFVPPFEYDSCCCFTLGENGKLIIIHGGEQLFQQFHKDANFLTVGDKREAGVGLPPGICRIQYVSTMDFLFLAGEDGTFFQTRDLLLGNYTELFKCEQGVLSFAVSPDCRRMTILTKQRTLLLLTLPDLECHVHQLSAIHEEVEVENMKCYTGSIAWRKDGRYFAVNVPVFSTGSVDSDSPKREIQVCDEEGSLYSKSLLEDFEILNNVLAWQPSGGLIATFGKSPHGNAIIFLELNGLKRSHIQLSHTKEVVNLCWNSASDILSIQYHNEVELWTRSNYVWMLKNTLMHGKNSSELQPVRFCSWDSDLPYRFHVVYVNYCAVYDMSSSYNSALSGGSAITVSWNGNKIYCTPFRDNSAPPPYGFLQANVESSIVGVLVSDFWDGFLCISHDSLVLFRRDGTSLTAVNKISFPENISVNEVDGWAWPNFNTLCCSINGDLKMASLQSVTKEKCEDCDFKLTLTPFQENLTKDVHFMRILPLVVDNQKETDELITETRNNMLVRVNLRTKVVTTVLSFQSGFSLSSCTIQYLYLQTKIVIFLHDTNTRQLFISSSEHANFEPMKIFIECTSIAVFCDSVLLTTSSGSLEILNKSLILELLQQQPGGSSAEVTRLLETKFSRKVEKGSVIVSCCVNRLLEPSLTLQIIPRGNLETICPRPLLVSTIRTILRDECSEGKYEKIMNALRRHRLDYRVLIDEMRTIENENPASTLQNSLKTMVDQVKDSHSLVLLVTDLDEEYEDCIRVIKDLLEPYLFQEAERRINIEEAYLASLAKLGLLEEALLSRLIQGENGQERNVVTHRVKFLSYYCNNQDILFDTSLGTYDLGLASLVADCLGKDPKEYVPMLDELNQLSDFKRKFKIDDKLRRYSKAVTYLIRDQSTQHQEVLKYMERHRLFTDVISVIEDLLTPHNAGNEEEFRSRDDLAKLLQESKFSYGCYLEEHTKFKEAMILYREGNQCDKAILCAIKCGEWENALDMFYSRSFTESDLKATCEHILNGLEDRRNYSGAARLCEVYLRDFPRAMGYWIRARKWMRARSLCHLLDKPQEDTVRPKLVEAAAERKEQLATLTAEISQHFRRWVAVKDAKAKRELDGGIDDLDNFSETDSMSSYSTRSGSSASGKSYRTTKNKRKHEKRLYSMKEGSIHEDLGITAHLWNVFDKIQAELKPDTSKLISSLWEFNENQLAKDLGISFDQLMFESGNAVKGIWTSILLDELIEMKYRIPPPGWPSSTWDKLCLHDPSSKAMKQ